MRNYFLCSIYTEYGVSLHTVLQVPHIWHYEYYGIHTNVIASYNETVLAPIYCIIIF